MNKKLLFIVFFCLFRSLHLFSQHENLHDLHTEDLFFTFSQPTPEMVKFVNGVEGKRVLNFNRELLEQYPDTIEKPEDIKFVSVGFSSAVELEKNIKALQIFSNLEYLEIKTAVQFRKSDIKDTLVLPDILNLLPTLKYLQLSGTYHFNYDDLFQRLLGLPSLQYLGFPHVLEDVQLPQSFLSLKNLRGIKLPGFKKILLPNDMKVMTNLESVVLVAEPYENFSDELIKLSTLRSLKHLALQFGKLNQEDLRQFQNFPRLEKFLFFNIEIDDVQDLINNIQEDNNLKEINLQNLKSNRGISDYTKLKKLEKLHISSHNNYKISLHESLYNLKNLNSLRIHTDSLFSISEKVGDLKNLEELNLSYNQITSLPFRIGELKMLELLDLTNNNISSLPPDLSGLTALKTLNLGNNSLTALPDNFGELINLTSLSLNNNKLTELPAGFGKLIKLETLHLHGNYLKILPVDIGNLRAVKRLNLDHNFLSYLPPLISHMEKLQYLQLSHNNLQELPEDFGNLIALEELYLGGNKNSSNPSIYAKVDENRPPAVFNDIKSLPPSFSKLENLKRVYLRHMTSLEAEELFEVFFKVPSENYHLDISNTGISYLPQGDWKNFLAGGLNMGGNVISNIPADIVNAPYLTDFIFKLSENDGLSYNLRGKAVLNAFFEEKGFIDFESLPKTEEMAKAYLTNAYNRKYTEGNNILELINKAFHLDSTYTEDNIRHSDYANALLKAGEYNKAIKYYDNAIARDTARGPYILNFILPNFKNRAVAHLAVGDTIAAIGGLEYASQRFSSGDWAKAGLLARAIGKDSLAFEYFNKGEQFYRDYIKGNLEADRVDYGYQLSLLELYLVKEDMPNAVEYLEILKTKQISETDKQLLLKYLGMVVDILQNEDVETDLNNLSRTIFLTETKISSWSFDLMKLWLKLTDVDEEKNTKIRNLTVALENKQ